MPGSYMIPPPPRGGLKDPNYRDWLDRTNPFWRWHREERPQEKERRRQRELYENSPEGRGGPYIGPPPLPVIRAPGEVRPDLNFRGHIEPIPVTLDDAQRWDAIGALNKMDLSPEEQAKVDFWRNSGYLPSSPKSPPLSESMLFPSENSSVSPYDLPSSPSATHAAETLKYKVPEYPDDSFSRFSSPELRPSRSDNYRMPDPLDDLLSGFPDLGRSDGSGNYRLPDWMERLISNPPASRYPPPQQSEDLPEWLQQLLEGQSD